MSITNSNISVKIANIQPMCWSKRRVNVSPRPFHALALRKQGKAAFEINNATFCSDSGDITYIPAGLGYCADYPEDNEITVIHFHSDSSEPPENFLPTSPAIINRLFEKALDIWTEKRQGYYYLCTAVFYEILANLSSDKTARLKNSGLYDDFFDAASYLNNNFTDNTISVSNLAKVANMSEAYFRKIFTEVYGTSPSVYITDMRLRHAENLLSSGKYSVNETALLSGFSDPKYFSRVVRKKYGCPPSKLFTYK